MRHIRVFIYLAVAWLLAGCSGYHALYGKGPGGLGVTTALATVSVPEQHTRAGQLVRNDLLTAMAGSGERRYDLNLTVTEKTLDVSALSASNLHRKRYNLVVHYDLLDVKSGSVLNSGDSFSNVSYDVIREPVSDLEAANNAQVRAAQELGADLRQRIAAYFSSKQPS